MHTVYVPQMVRRSAYSTLRIGGRPYHYQDGQDSAYTWMYLLKETLSQWRNLSTEQDSSSDNNVAVFLLTTIARCFLFIYFSIHYHCLLLPYHLHPNMCLKTFPPSWLLSYAITYYIKVNINGYIMYLQILNGFHCCIVPLKWSISYCIGDNILISQFPILSIKV